MKKCTKFINMLILWRLEQGERLGQVAREMGVSRWLMRIWQAEYENGGASGLECGSSCRMFDGCFERRLTFGTQEWQFIRMVCDVLCQVAL